MKEGDVICYSLKGGFWKRETGAIFFIYKPVVVAIWRIKTIKK